MGMECLEPAYLNLPGWRCVPVYALPLSPTSPPVTPPPTTHQLPVPPHLPLEPSEWCRQHVLEWIEWCVDHFSLPLLDVDNFHMNGKGLCLLQKQDFRERAPRCGDVLYNALHILISRNKEKPTSASPSAHETEGVPWSSETSEPLDSDPALRSNSDVESSPPHTLHEDVVHGNPAQNLPTSHIPPQTQLGEEGNASEKINVRLLWDFLQQLLNDAAGRYRTCIVWKDRARAVFKITDPHRLAALWGRQKNHLNMNFDKMSRALRYYYRVRILQKEPGERHCYRFLRPPNELRHCKQRALLAHDTRLQDTALDMSIKEEVL